MRRALTTGVLLLCACGETWAPETLIEDLRVIGMRAEPAEIKPGESATLTALVLDPSRPGKRSTVLWLGCDPDPFNLGRSACSDPVALQDPAALLGNLDGGLPPGVKFIGLNESAAYGADPELFHALDAGDPRRITGTVGQVLAIVIGKETTGIPGRDELAALLRPDAGVQSVIALFRIKVSEAATRNANPVISNFLVEGEPQFPGARTQLMPAEKVFVAVDAPESSFEPYVQSTPTGDVAKVEQLTSAWYSTSGRFNYNRIALRGEVKGIFTAPGAVENPTDPVPENRTGTFYVVMRDTRGGQSWADFPYFICDATLPAPKIAAVHSPATRGDVVVIEGQNLGSLLDVVIGGVALQQGVVNPSSSNWEGLAPATLDAGTYVVRVHGKECSRGETAFTLTLP